MSGQSLNKLLQIMFWAREISKRRIILKVFEEMSTDEWKEVVEKELCDFLSESHISIHTWPEHGLINVDIYLSNFQRNNDGTVEGIYKKMQEYFQASVSQEQTIIR